MSIPGKPHAGRLRVERAAHPAAIEDDVGVVHDLLVARQDLDRAHVPRAVHRRGKDDVPERVGAFRRQREGLRRRQHEIWRAQLPARGKGRRRRQRRRSPSGEPARCQAASVAISASLKPTLADEAAVARLRWPWRHVAAGRHLDDLPGAAAGIVERQQRERTRTAGVMAGSAVPEQDRRDVARERRSGGHALRMARVRRPGRRPRG